ncbi:MAG: hypothetical protein JYX80_12200 [Candidatus Scalindua sediminis]|nr:hypothetical protein [Candidatus Scalindua sediminis]
MKIYVGNLSYEISEEDLRQAFEQSGKVQSVTIGFICFYGFYDYYLSLYVCDLNPCSF